MATQTITVDNFQGTIDKPGIVVLDFWGTRCMPCRTFAPIFEQVSQDNLDVVFGKICTDEQPELAQALEIRAVPTLMVFRDGILVFRDEGALPKKAFAQLVDEARKLDMDKVKSEVEAAVAKEN
ncbi:MAG: thiol reductase thioredoxin [Deltaproteobacteria bacterium]|nr:thiol reductase thioredoxin [Deltaproteobacteria bacterium]